jgi:hypothetical protein
LNVDFDVVSNWGGLVNSTANVDGGSLFNKTFPLVLSESAASVIKDTTPPVTARDGIRALELEDAILKSHMYNTTVVPYHLIDEE